VIAFHPSKLSNRINLYHYSVLQGKQGVDKSVGLKLPSPQRSLSPLRNQRKNLWVLCALPWHRPPGQVCGWDIGAPTPLVAAGKQKSISW